ncbi:MAG TPA: helix-turn-helix domain-containing protein [Planctomycetota bacterium]|nr:helix-turn-helix domain-containing protein [Planctomycetota bacterium]
MTSTRKSIQDLDLDGKAYVLLPKAEYERLRLLAEGKREDATPFGKESVGLDLRARRHGAGLTLSQVAGRAGIAVETLSRIENGRTDPSVRTVRSVLRALEGGA